MFFALKGLQRNFKLDVGGFLHVGAHQAEEYDVYAVYGLPVYWVEANTEKCRSLAERFAGDALNHVICALVSENAGDEVVFHVANNGHSSSMLELGIHASEYPDIRYVHEEHLKTDTLQNLIRNHAIPRSVNFLNLDIQGAELLALRGLGESLDQFDYIYTEVNTDYMYQGCALMHEIDEFLADFCRVKTAMVEGSHWGEAFYIRRALLPSAAV